MKKRALFLAVAITSTAAFAPVGSTSAEAEGVGSDNFTLVQNLPHESGGRGSDIEFLTLTFNNATQAQKAGFTKDPAADALPDVKGIQKDIALAGTTGAQFHLYDITTPGAAYQTAAYECPANQGDTQVFSRTEKNGKVRWFTTYTVEDGGSSLTGMEKCGEDAGLEAGAGTEGGKHTGTFIIEITNPFKPKAVAFIPVEEGSHNGTVHPSGNYFYNSNSSLINEVTSRMPGIEVYDISDFANITRTKKLALPFVPASLGTESHDITFNEAGDRAYSAALSQGVIIDTSDPADPKVLSNWVDPTINVWHQADPIQVGDRTLLVVEDEVAGAVGTGQCPNGGVHVFDVTGDPAQPAKLGYWNIDEPRVHALDASSPAYSCTAHVFRLYPEAGMMTISYYNGGVRVVDLNGLAGIGLGARTVQGDPMLQVGWRRFANSNSWAAKAPRIPVVDGKVQDFHVYSNGARGLDVLAFDADDAASAAEAAQYGRWLTPAEAAATLTRFTPEQLTAFPEYSCLL